MALLKKNKKLFLELMGRSIELFSEVCVTLVVTVLSLSCILQNLCIFLGKTSVDRVRNVIEYGNYYLRVKEKGYPKSDPVQALGDMCSTISVF